MEEIQGSPPRPVKVLLRDRTKYLGTAVKEVRGHHTSRALLSPVPMFDISLLVLIKGPKIHISWANP